MRKIVIIPLLMVLMVLMLLMVFVCMAVPGLQAQEKEMSDELADFIRGRKLFEVGKYREALDSVNKSIKKYGESVRWLTGKFYILKALNRTEEALQVGIKREGMAMRKVPFKSLELAHLALQLKQKEVALEWIEEAVNRGYMRYRDLQAGKRYKSLYAEPRFIAAVNQIKANIGIGKPAKPIEIYTTEPQTETQSQTESERGKDGKNKENTGDENKEGEKQILVFSLAAQKGKVVLVNFWAAWNADCVKEIPELKRLYHTYHKKGLEIIGISLDNEIEAVAALEKKEQLPWQTVFSGKGYEDEVCKRYGVRAIPSGWLIDKKGILRHFGLSGRARETAVAELLAE